MLMLLLMLLQQLMLERQLLLLLLERHLERNAAADLSLLVQVLLVREVELGVAAAQLDGCKVKHLGCIILMHEAA
jgi:hypothetical protein